MPLEMREVCKTCGCGLSPDGPAFICSYECTYCPRCARRLGRVCPDCKGEMVVRPRRRAAPSVAAG